MLWTFGSGADMYDPLYLFVTVYSDCVAVKGKKEEIKNPQTSLIIDECQNLINVCWAIYELHPGADLNPDWV